MRKVIVSEFVSRDGVMEAPDRWHFPFWHDEMGAYKRDELFASDALLLGRVTYEDSPRPGRASRTRRGSPTG